MSENPYQPPLAVPLAESSLSSDEEIRRKHLAHEASVKSIGILYIIGGIVMLLMLPVAAADEIIYAIGAAILAILFIAIAIGIRRLSTWARYCAAVVSAFGLLGVPLGTLINLYILWLLLSKKGRTVFSPAYKGIIAATPGMKYKTSRIAWMVLAVVLVAFVALVAGLIVFAP